MFDRMKRPRRGKGTGDGSDAGEDAEEEAALPGDEPERTFGKRTVPLATDGAAEPPRAKTTRPKKYDDEDFTTQPVEDTPATNWRKAAKAGKLVKRSGKPITPEQMELSRLRAENQRLKMEMEILKKAAAYFAKESL